MIALIIIALWCVYGVSPMTVEPPGSRPCKPGEHWLAPVEGDCSSYLDCSDGHLTKAHCPLTSFFGFDQKELKCRFRYFFSRVDCDNGNSTEGPTKPPGTRNTSSVTGNHHHTVTAVTTSAPHSTVPVTTSRAERNSTTFKVPHPSHSSTSSSRSTYKSTILTSTWSSVQINSTVHVIPRHNETTTTPKGKPGKGSGEQVKVNGWVISFVIVIMLTANV